uniref:Inner centromere protein n=1 Tax=Latimeria chalumnae TaxID=7897 RepID=H3BD83_LATCH
MAEMADMAHLYRMITCKLDDFVQVVDTHTLWLEEIQEAAEKMFNSNFNPEPEIMPKTPSQKNRRRKKRLSVAKDENKTSNKKRLSRRRSNIKHSLRLQNKENNLENVVNAVEDKPQRMTRAAARAILATSISTSPSEKEHSAIVHMEGKVPLVEISVNDRGIAEFSRKGYVPEMVEKFEIMILSSEDEKSPSKKAKEPSGAEVPVLVVPETPEDGSLKRADPSIPRPEEQDCAVKEQGVLVDGRKAPDTVADVSLEDLAKGSKPVRRSGRRSRLSLSKRRSLFDQYSLASKRESMNKAAIRRSVRKSLSRKKAALGSSASSCLSYSVEMVEEEPVVPDRSKTESKEPVEQVSDVSEEPRMSLRTRNVNKIAISNLPAKAQAPEPEQEQGKTLLRTHKTCTKELACIARRNSYKRALAEIQDGTDDVDGAHSPAKKKTPSPPWPANKVIHPHMKTFLHTVKKNQLLMTPGSIGSNMVVKSFIKRNTPQKVDSKRKEKEWQRLETLRKKQEAEEKRKQKIEEEKKRKLEEVKRKREERLQRVMRARERVEQQEEEKKKKIEQKFAHFDEKSEKAREERIAEEKAKKKVALKKMEEAEARRRQEEEARKQKLQQQEEEERKHKELLQKKREEEEQERLKKIAEAKKQAEQRQERALERKKALEKIQAEKERERQEKEKALQLQRELERVAREEAAREKERLRKEVEEKEKQRLEEVERQRQEQEKQAKLRKEQEEKERKLQEEKRAKEQQATASEKLANTAVVKKQQTTAESYEMTPKGSGKPKASKNNLDNYGMDLNSDDSTDDEGAPRKAIPAWADEIGQLLHQAIIHQYYNPVDVDKKFGVIASPDLEQIFSKSKPRYFKRTSSAVWHSPPTSLNRSNLSSAYILKK